MARSSRNQEPTEEPFVIRLERNWDAFWDFFKRRRGLAILFIVLGFLYVAFVSWTAFFKDDQAAANQVAEAERARENAVRERDDARWKQTEAQSKLNEMQARLAEYAARVGIETNTSITRQLELVLKRQANLEQQLSNTASLVATRLPKSRALSEDAATRIIAKLKRAKLSSVTVNAESPDSDTTQLVSQLQSVFNHALGRTNVSGLLFFIGASHVPQGFGVLAKAKQVPDNLLVDALEQIFSEIGQEPRFQLDDKLGESELLILVGPP